ncbi:MAG: acetate uptake transporter [Streptosporangiaceae bacterium]
MTSTDKGIEPAAATAAPVAPPASATGVAWGNSGPICLGGFATTTFMLSMVNANLVPAVLTTTVLAVALMFGGLAQLIGGILQLRIGNTFGGALFTGFGAFWLSIWVWGQLYLAPLVLIHQAGHALGLLLYAFGIFAVVIFLASFRTSVAVVIALLLLVAALFILAAGNYGGSTGLIKTGGWIGIVLAGFAFYLALAELCAVEYGREILPVGHLAKTPGESLGEE